MADELLESITDVISEGLYFVDREQRITYWNKGAERITGYSKAEVLGRTCSDNILRHVDTEGRQCCEDGCPMPETIADGLQRDLDLYLHHKDGHRVPVRIHVIAIKGPGGGIEGVAQIFSDRSERSTLVAELEALKKEVLSDPLTGLGNRRFAEMMVAARFRDLEAEGIPFGILMLDIDHFKAVNDEHGHLNGDFVLRMVASTLANSLRRLDAATRWGGEEFVVISPNVSMESLREMAERSRVLVSRSWIDTEEGCRVGVTVSIGGAMARRGDSYESLLSRADGRLFDCKKGGRDRVLVGD